MNKPSATALTTLLLAVLPACSSSPDEPVPSQPCGTVSGTGCAPDSQRVDLYLPAFGDPTTVDNPLYPISTLASVVFLGHVDGEPFRTETTLLPATRSITWNGAQVETLESQYLAFRSGRIEEIALDWYAQDDTGGVWYFGEDVTDYEDGVVLTKEGTWLVERDGPLAMIMPAAPRVGDAWRSENAPGIAWEEVTVTAVDVTVDGASGPVAGAIIGSELHMDETREEKVFAPDRGEFSTGTPETDLEAMALAVPADALGTAMPAELATIATDSAALFDAAAADDWTAAAAALASIETAWAARNGDPAMLAEQMQDALDALAAAVAAQDAGDTQHQAIATARAAYDLELRHRPVTEVDLARFELWLAQVPVDVAASEPGNVKGDAVTLELTWNRIAHTFSGTEKSAIESDLADLQAAADAEDGAQAAAVAASLRASIAGWE
jgi:hypothetical protein